MAPVEQLRKERDEYRKAYLERLNLYNTLLKMYAEAIEENTKLNEASRPKNCLVVQFKKSLRYGNK